jgi:hypothetical protein
MIGACKQQFRNAAREGSRYRMGNRRHMLPSLSPLPNRRFFVPIITSCKSGEGGCFISILSSKIIRL